MTTKGAKRAPKKGKGKATATAPATGKAAENGQAPSAPAQPDWVRTAPAQEKLALLGTKPLHVPVIRDEPLMEAETTPLECRIIYDRKVRLDDKRAAWYLELPIFPGERPIIDGHVQFLRDEIAKGTFNANGVTMATCKLTTDGVTYKINGQHTSWAKFYFSDEVFAPTVREVHYEADSMHQLKLLYASFDRGKPRPESHLVRVQLADSEVLEGIRGDICSRLASAMKLWIFEKKEDANRARSGDIATLVTTQYAATFRAVGLFLQGLKDGTGTAHLKRAPVHAAMLETFYRVPTIAPQFWDAVATGINLDAGDPRLAIRNYLLVTALGKIGAGSLKRVVDPETMYRACVVAWNHWRGERKLDNVRPTNKRLKAV